MSQDHELFQIAERQVFEPGQVIIAEGQTGSAMYVVQEGEVVIYKQTARGERELGRVGVGGVFGEMALVDNKPRMASARADQTTTLRLVRRDKFQEKLKKADPFLRAVMKILVNNLRDIAEKVN